MSVHFGIISSLKGETPHKQSVPSKIYFALHYCTLRKKWERKGALEFAFDKDKPLGQWHNIIQDLYGIELSL